MPHWRHYHEGILRRLFFESYFREQRAQCVVGNTHRQARVMIHYICDRCKRQIRTADQVRYVVQIDIQTAVDHHREEIDDDVDQLAELHQLLEGIVNANTEDDSCESSHHGRYDLCPDCHRQFLKNPLGRDAMLALGFSNN
jgi:hypothetical protein